MDETDLRICVLLIQNARTPYRDMADRLGISVQAVHRRVQDLVDAGVLGAFRARVSAESLGAVSVDMLGVAGETDLDILSERLKEDDRVSTIYASSGRTFFISGSLRSVSELGGYVERVSERAGMRDPIVGILSLGRVGDTTVGQGGGADRSLTPLDRRIIAALRDDARRPVEEIALELRIASSTARRRLQRLMDDRLIDLTVDLYPGRMPGIVSLLWMRVRPGTDRLALAKEITDRYGPRVLLFGSYGNLPEVLPMLVWSRTLAEQSDMEAELRPQVQDVVNHVLLRKRSFSTWVDRMA